MALRSHDQFQVGVGMQDQFFENKARNGPRNGKQDRIRDEKWAGNGKRDRIRDEKRVKWETRRETSFFNEKQEKQGKTGTTEEKKPKTGGKN